MPTPNDPRQTTRTYAVGAAQKVASGASSAQSNSIGYEEVLVTATQNAWIAWGANPTAVAATAGNLYLVAGEKFHFRLNASDKIAAIQDASAGAVYIFPVG